MNPVNLLYRTLYTSLCISLAGVASLSFADDYSWNAKAPVKTPAAGTANGKTVLFDVSHGGTEGNADWVIDGGFSDFADALVKKGFRVEEYRGVDLNQDGQIRYVDDLASAQVSPANEAIIRYDAIKDADVLVLAESNRPFKVSEYQALEQFVAAGKGIYFIADHYNADRNQNTWDATEVFNGYNRSRLDKYNIGGDYGDLRNPGTRPGWLATTFGIRYRFNAINYLPGASDIMPASQTEGITSGIKPVLIAAGSTLAIVDASKAKGLVYLAPSDTPSRWPRAADHGLYFSGHDEGPFVAIAKAGRGKAAFIGDSSPIEDASAKYRRQDSGARKHNHRGWKDPGNAATLSVNLVQWLATQEDYTAFDDRNGHRGGKLTATTKAPVEMDDPENGIPWGKPNHGFHFSDPSSFADGSYGAPHPATNSYHPRDHRNNQLNDDNQRATLNTVNVRKLLTMRNGRRIRVRGVISGAVNDRFGLKLSDSQSSSSVTLVKLDSQYRKQFSPQLNPAIIGKTVLIHGTKNDYLSKPGIRKVTSIEIIRPLAALKK